MATREQKQTQAAKKLSPETEKKMCFVIGPIGKDGSPERRHSDLLLHAIIKDVLERDDHGFRVKRADEDADPGMIGDRMVTDIINADLVIADLTDLNPNAFYELGIRHSTEKPAIHVAKFGTVLPFDNVTHRTIFIDLSDWHSIQQGRDRLSAAAKLVMSPGYQVSNPITQANATFKMRQSEDPRERIIAELEERLSRLERPAPIARRRETDKLTPFRQLVAHIEAMLDSLRAEGASQREILRRLRSEPSSALLDIQFLDDGRLKIESGIEIAFIDSPPVATSRP